MLHARLGAALPSSSIQEGTARVHPRVTRRCCGGASAAHFATTSVLARLLDQSWLLPVAISAARDPAVFVDIAAIG
ncbi:MAG TPA: hypothetical protein VMM13_05330, partial [Euzebya sp.]|nr:hypothetical protein [Euzebya sp.]